ncbi:MAG: hypothetical protein JXR72_00550 [Proteobacteria bacterium]|nr:hypothetical protein [Pseudomonadota bacterium]
MERRLNYFDQMNKGLESIKEGRVQPDPEEEAVEEKEAVSETEKREYVARMKTRLTAWSSELNNLEGKIRDKIFDEECFARMEDLDIKLAQGFETMRCLMETMDGDWLVGQKKADALLQDIMDTFDKVRDYARGGAEFL